MRREDRKDMKRLVILYIVLALSACTTVRPRPASVTHVVLVWLKDSVTAAELAEIREHTLDLRAIPGVTAVRVGSAVPSRRPIEDDSFDLGVVMDFESVEAMRHYVDDPRHEEFVRRYVKGRAERLLIYDIRTDVY
jgi:hypothetical protein